jgi:capsular exopolysaccharide synthesis family protein
VVHHERAAKSYTATASVTFQNGTLSESALQVTPTGSSEPQREADTETLIAHSPEVASAVRKQLHLSTEAGELLNQVKVETAANADVLNIVASTGDPRYSARLANAFAEQYIAFRTTSQLAGIESAQRTLQSQIAALPADSPERAALQQSLQRLSELRAVAGGGASIIGLATPPSEPSGMSLGTTVIISIIIGLAIAFLLVFLLESLDRRLKSIEEFELEYKLPVLVGIEQSSFGPRSAEERGDALEPYRILRSALDFAAVTRPLDTLLLTSAVSSEGKTTVAVDLAHAIALSGRRVALVEFDLRLPTFARHFDLDTDRGFTTVFSGDHTISNLMVQPFADLSNLSVLPAGQLPPNPSELLGSPVVTETLSELSRSHDIVIIDAPPLNPVADAQVLLNNSAIQAVLVVARVDLTTREQVRRARAILDRHMAEPIGIVVTGLREAGRYGYGRYGVPESKAPGAFVAAGDLEERSRRLSDPTRSLAN